MRAIIVGDVHIADRPPSARKDGYREDILEKLEWVVDYSNDNDSDVLLLLGDLFHVPRPDRNSHGLVQSTAAVLGRSNAPVRIVPGNHDLVNTVLTSLPTQPLGTLCLHPNIDLLIGPDPEFPMFGVPFVDPTPENLDYWAEKYHADGGPDKYPTVPTHQGIFPLAETPIYEFVAAEEWSSNFEAKFTPYGHIHSRMNAGAFYEIGGTWFCNNGAISRGSLHDETIHRELAITEFDDSDADTPYTSVPIPFKPPEEVFDLDSVFLQKERKAQVADFLESLGSTELTYLTAESLIAQARSIKGLTKKAVDELEDIILSR